MENLELAETVLQRIEEHPEEFDMGTWLRATRRNGEPESACKTRACLAGHAMLAAGYELRWYPVTGYAYDELASGFIRPDGSAVFSEADEGRELLGLSDDEYYCHDGDDDLFHLGSDDEALARFRELVEAERASRAAVQEETT